LYLTVLKKNKGMYYYNQTMVQGSSKATIIGMIKGYKV